MIIINGKWNNDRLQCDAMRDARNNILICCRFVAAGNVSAWTTSLHWVQYYHNIFTPHETCTYEQSKHRTQLKHLCRANALCVYIY